RTDQGWSWLSAAGGATQRSAARPWRPPGSGGGRPSAALRLLRGRTAAFVADALHLAIRRPERGCAYLPARALDLARLLELLVLLEHLFDRVSHVERLRRDVGGL